MNLFEKKNKTDFIVSFQTNSIKTKQTKSDWKLIGSLCFFQLTIIYLFIFFLLQMI